MSKTKHLTASEREKYWSSKVNNYHQSGLSQREYCMKNNISYWSFNTWKRRLDNKPGKSKLHEVSREILKNLSTPQENFEIIFNETIRISIPDNFSKETLSRILQVFGDIK